MLRQILTNEWVICGLVGLGLLLLGKIINDKKLEAWGAAHKALLDGMALKIGQRISSLGRTYLGIKGSERLESKGQSWGLAYFRGLMPGGQVPFGPALMKGLDMDDKDKGKK